MMGSADGPGKHDNLPLLFLVRRERNTEKNRIPMVMAETLILRSIVKETQECRVLGREVSIYRRITATSALQLLEHVILEIESVLR